MARFSLAESKSFPSPRVKQCQSVSTTVAEWRFLSLSVKQQKLHKKKLFPLSFAPEATESPAPMVTVKYGSGKEANKGIYSSVVKKCALLSQSF
jgi:hypothetical protein